MEPIRCPLCDAPLRAKRGDPWEIIRSLAAVHLRQCAKGPEDDREVATLAIRIADDVQNEAH
ncbi:MAG TPA: hypothetical protein VLU46_05545 [Thermoanaerobaculia bacterium]|nr:hypothetical protein [Thermoanaerobaculia bacterium]